MVNLVLGPDLKAFLDRQLENKFKSVEVAIWEFYTKYTQMDPSYKECKKLAIEYKKQKS